VASGLDDETCLAYIDRFLMYYIHTADPLTRTARGLEELEGGMQHLRSVVVDDGLGIAAQLEADMQGLIDSYQCEWKRVVDDPALQRNFRAFVNDPAPDPSVAFVAERGQKRPASGGAPREPRAAA
jgi:nitrite reductase (NADH) large subunit